MKPKTYHEGANDERTAILAKVRRMVTPYWTRKAHPPEIDVMINGTELIKFLLQRNERYNKRKGGL